MLIVCYVLTVILFLSESQGRKSDKQEGFSRLDPIKDPTQRRKSDKGIATDYSYAESPNDAKETDYDFEDPGNSEVLKEAKITENEGEPDKELELGWSKNHNNVQTIEEEISDSQAEENNQIVDNVVHRDVHQFWNVPETSQGNPFMEFFDEPLNESNKYSIEYRRFSGTHNTERNPFTGIYTHNHATPDREFKEQIIEVKPCITTLKELYTCIFC
ncbi:hypothetical protein NPIL_362931, partial [Nephila pilipes]